MKCSDVQLQLGAYALDVLDPLERREVESHLGGCAECRRELAAVDDVPRLLGLLAPEDWERVSRLDDGAVPAPDAEPTAGASRRVSQHQDRDAVQLDRLLASAAAVHAKRRWLTMAAAVLLVLTGGGVVAAELRPDRQPAVVAQSTSWSATDPDTGVRADVRLHPQPEGTALDVDLAGVPSGTTCRLVVTARDGATSTAATWPLRSNSCGSDSP